MLPQFPQAVPEILVSNIDKAAKYYVSVLGFSSAPSMAQRSVIVWLNLDSKPHVGDRPRFHGSHHSSPVGTAHPQHGTVAEREAVIGANAQPESRSRKYRTMVVYLRRRPSGKSCR